jgi:hypothetical protein
MSQCSQLFKVFYNLLLSLTFMNYAGFCNFYENYVYSLHCKMQGFLLDKLLSLDNGML